MAAATITRHLSRASRHRHAFRTAGNRSPLPGFPGIPVLLFALLCPWALFPGLLLAETPPPDGSGESPAGSPGSEASKALVPGGTVRLRTTLPRGSIKGTIKTLDAAGITVMDLEGEEVDIPWTSIRHLDLQVGVRHRYGTCALIGGGVGALFGLLIPNEEECFAPGCPDEEAFPRSQAVIVGAAVGALTGLIAEGASAPSAPRWERVRPPYLPRFEPSISLGVTRNRGGTGLVLVLGF